MNFLNFDLRKLLLLSVLMAIPLASVNLQKESPDGPWLFQPFYYLSGLTQSMYSSFSHGVRNTTDLYLNLIDIKKHNREIRGELEGLKAQLSEFNELRLENERLNELLDFRKKTKMDLLAAKVIGRDLFNDYEKITINRGQNDGVTKGMASITTAGGVGYILHAEGSTSQLLLLTDRYATIDAVVQRSRVRGILHGYTKDNCLLKYLKRSDDVQVGDLIVTSGLDNIFPKGFPLGTVIDVEKDDYGFDQVVKVKPVVNGNNLEEVFIVLDSQNQNFEELTSPEAAKEVPVETTSPTVEAE